MSESNGQLRAFVERIEEIEAEIAEWNASKSDLFKEAKGCGFDVSALREVIGIRRKRGRDPSAFEEKSAIVDLYLTALDEAALDLVHARSAPSRMHAREEPPHDPDTGEIIETGASATQEAVETATDFRPPVEMNGPLQQTTNGASRDGEMLDARLPGANAEGERRPQRQEGNAQDGGRIGNDPPATAHGVTAGETATPSLAKATVDNGASSPTSDGAGVSGVASRLSAGSGTGAPSPPRPVRRESHDRPPKPLIVGGHAWTNIIEGYGVEPGEVERFRANFTSAVRPIVTPAPEPVEA